MENKSKANTFIGFAIRARKFRIGMNAVQTLKSINLLIVCKSASENTQSEALKVANKYHCPLIVTIKENLEEITHRENAKIMAVADKALAKAILDNIENDFIVKK